MSGGWLAAAGGRLLQPVRKLLQFLQPLAESSSTTPSSSSIEAEIKRLSEDLAYVERTWERIEVFIEDAEQREVQDKSVRLWLSELRVVADEADDLLDLYQYEAIAVDGPHFNEDVEQQELKGGHFSEWPGASLFDVNQIAKEVEDREEAWSSSEMMVNDEVWVHRNPLVISPLQDPNFREKLTGGVKKIRDRFDEIDRTKNALNLKEFGEVRINRSIIDRSPAGSLPVEPQIFGRDVELQKVVDILTSGDDIHVHVPAVVALVGMGGVGKTTLAQHAFKRPEVCNHFQRKAWVCVSDEFEVVSLTQKVLQAFTMKDSGLIELCPLQEKLKSHVEGKKFLLVMDDIWNEKNILWGKFLACLRYGATGSKILITTRNHGVAKTTQAIEEIPVSYLSKDDAWHLFRQFAFRSPEKSHSYPRLVPIGREIAMKCKGLPLALKVLGSRLSDLDDPSAWQDVLECDLWDISVWEDGKQILGPLLLSYLHLPAHLKPCLKLCCVFPKDTSIHWDDLVSLMVANDKIVVKNRDNWMDLEAMARRYIRDLASRSFLQMKGSHNNYSVTMHDLIHDLVQFLTEDAHNNIARGVESITTSGGGMRSIFLTSGILPDRRNLERLRALFYRQKFRHGNLFLDSYFISKHLRCVRLHLDTIEKIDMEQICRLYNLRQLDISIFSQKDVKFPLSIANLKHLLTLSLYPARAVKKLLKYSLFRLPKLRFMHLTDVRKEETFISAGNMSNIDKGKCFEIYERGRGAYCPPALMARLKRGVFGYLEECSDEGEKMGDELENTMQFQGKLCISRVDNVIQPEEAEHACLKKREVPRKRKRNMEVAQYDQSWLEYLANKSTDPFQTMYDELLSEFLVDISDGPFRKYDTGITQHDERLLENFRPHPYSQSLEIRRWRGAQLPSWLTDDPPLLSRLNTLEFYECAGLVSLPSLGHITTLKSLQIIGCPIKSIPVDFFSSTLQTLRIISCELLTSMLLYGLPALEHLTVKSCSYLEVIRFSDPLSMGQPMSSANINPSLNRLEIGECCLLRDVQFPSSIIIHYIYNCPLFKLPTG